MTTSLGRRLELILGGPARPFDLTVREANMLDDALELLDESHRRGERECPPEDAMDAQSDSETHAHIYDLRRRLRRFAGYRT